MEDDVCSVRDWAALMFAGLGEKHGVSGETANGLMRAAGELEGIGNRLFETFYQAHALAVANNGGGRRKS